MRKNGCAPLGRRHLGLLALAGCIVWSGCDSGSSDKGEMVKPEVSPDVKAKESMDAYLKSNPKAAKGAAKK
jgi:hypothetical protein